MIEIIIPNRNRSIGPMDVRRVLPFAKRRSVGPFVFVDDFGPVEIVRNRSLDVLPHPHIGLATVTYLFSGSMTHRDSLGTVQIIRPGEINLMTAGSGIVHPERVSDAPLEKHKKAKDRVSKLYQIRSMPNAVWKMAKICRSLMKFKNGAFTF